MSVAHIPLPAAVAAVSGTVLIANTNSAASYTAAQQAEWVVALSGTQKAKYESIAKQFSTLRIDSLTKLQQDLAQAIQSSTAKRGDIRDQLMPAILLLKPELQRNYEDFIDHVLDIHRPIEPGIFASAASAAAEWLNPAKPANKPETQGIISSIACFLPQDTAHLCSLFGKGSFVARDDEGLFAELGDTFNYGISTLQQRNVTISTTRGRINIYPTSQISSVINDASLTVENTGADLLVQLPAIRGNNVRLNINASAGSVRVDAAASDSAAGYSGQTQLTANISGGTASLTLSGNEKDSITVSNNAAITVRNARTNIAKFINMQSSNAAPNVRFYMSDQNAVCAIEGGATVAVEGFTLAQLENAVTLPQRAVIVTPAPSAAPTTQPSAAPTSAPSAEPTAQPSAAPTAQPSTEPTYAPSAAPSAAPTAAEASTSDDGENALAVIGAVGGFILAGVLYCIQKQWRKSCDAPANDAAPARSSDSDLRARAAAATAPAGSHAARVRERAASAASNSVEMGVV